MDLVTRALAVLLALTLVAACSDDDDGDAPFASVSTVEPNDGGLDIDTPGDSQAIPVPSFGFGLAVPAGWQATLLTADALERLDALPTSAGAGAFLAAARVAEATGAVLYASGVDTGGRVAELKVDRRDGVGATLESLRADAEAVADEQGVDDFTVDELEIDGAPAVRLRFVATFDSAEGDDEIETWISQYFVLGSDERIYSAIITAEIEVARDELDDLFVASFVLAG